MCNQGWETVCRQLKPNGPEKGPRDHAVLCAVGSEQTCSYTLVLALERPPKLICWGWGFFLKDPGPQKGEGPPLFRVWAEVSGRRGEGEGWLGEVEGFVGSRRTMGGLPGGPVVGICLAVQEMCTQSLAWELRCHVPRATKPWTTTTRSVLLSLHPTRGKPRKES